MNNAARIKSLIQNIADVQRPALFRAVVKSVDKDICTVKIGDLELTNVRLRAIKNDKEDTLLITPQDGSIVLLADLSDGEMRDLAVIAHSEVEETLLKIGKLEFKADHDTEKFLIKSQDESLGKIISDFIDEVIKVVVVHGRTPDIEALKDIKERLEKVLEC